MSSNIYKKNTAMISKLLELRKCHKALFISIPASLLFQNCPHLNQTITINSPSSFFHGHAGPIPSTFTVFFWHAIHRLGPVSIPFIYYILVDGWLPYAVFFS